MKVTDKIYCDIAAAVSLCYRRATSQAGFLSFLNSQTVNGWDWTVNRFDHTGLLALARIPAYGPNNIRMFLQLMQEEVHSVAKHAKSCFIPRSTAYEILKQWNESDGTVIPIGCLKKPSKIGGAKRANSCKITAQQTVFLAELVDKNPCITIDMAKEEHSSSFEGFSISQSGLRKHMVEKVRLSLKDSHDYLDDVAYKINNYLPSYQNYIKKLKEEGYKIIGYIRKSPGKEPDDRRRQLLKTMSLNLKERSLVDVVFASPCSQASDPMQSRDKNQHTLLDEIDVEGSTQDLMKFIASEIKVCLATLDYAGLSTNCLDLKEFLSEKTQIKKIIVDLFPYTNEMIVYDCKQLLEDPVRLKVFNCRKAFYRRSK